MLVLFLGVTALGINSLLNMPRGEDPEFTLPQFAVVVVYPGTDALDMEKLIVFIYIPRGSVKLIKIL